MATSDQTPSSALLRLRPADVVRLCGLTAAATGLDLAASHSVVGGQRVGDRLLATVNDAAGASAHAVWAEISDEGGDAARWACDCAHAGPLACAHVAALLSAWIAHPGDFLIPGAEPDEGDPLPQPLPDAGRGARPEPVPAPRVLAQDSPFSRRRGGEGEKASPTTLAATLAQMNATDMVVIARRIFGEAEGSDDIGARIVAALSDPARVQALLHRLDESARRLLALLALVGGATTSADLEALAARLTVPLSALRSDLAVLERHALLLPMLPTRAPSEHGPGATWRHVAGWRIPDEVRRALSVSLTLPMDALPAQGPGWAAPPLIEPHGAPVRVLRNTPRTLCLALALLAEAPPPLGLPSVASANTPDDEPAPVKQGNLLAPGELAPERLQALARNAGVDAGALRLARRLLLQARDQQPGPARVDMVDMARVPVSERPVVLRAAFRRWLRSDSAADILDLAASGAARIRYDSAHSGFRPSIIAREVSDGRRFVARLLSHVQPDVWYAMDDLVTLAWQAHPGFLRGQQSAYTTPVWRLESPREQRPLQPRIREDWMAAEGAFIRSLVGGVFALWGVVDLALREDGPVAAFRLTPFGAYLFRRDDDPADDGLAALCDADWGPAVLPLREGSLTVQPLAGGAQLLAALALWATPTAVSGRRLVYTLSADRACAAFDRNLAPDALPALLRPLHSRAAEGVAARLSQWHTEWGKTRILTGYTLVEASDEATLVEALAAAPDLAARCRRLSPTLALAPPADAAILRTLLARRGYAV
ncbi:MAG TPA: hypothetical protein VFQ32_06805 [Ktedonobacterales bacterium]|nr:hypothetical protein [Ktedonobacterales bacterium]